MRKFDLASGTAVCGGSYEILVSLLLYWDSLASRAPDPVPFDSVPDIEDPEGIICWAQSTLSAAQDAEIGGMSPPKADVRQDDEYVYLIWSGTFTPERYVDIAIPKHGCEPIIVQWDSGTGISSRYLNIEENVLPFVLEAENA